MTTNRITFDSPPEHDDPSTITRDEITAALSKRPGKWAIVARHDRAARATSHVERIQSGREYGAGFESVARIVGNEHRVYARFIESTSK